jgi:hypothetical protein
MDPVSEQSPPTYSDPQTFASVLGLLLILAILTATTYLTIRGSSEPGGILHGARVWSRNYFYTRANPRLPKGQGPPDFADDNSDDDVPYGAPGLFDDQSSAAAQANCNGEDVAENDDNETRLGVNCEGDRDARSGLVLRPLGC